MTNPDDEIRTALIEALFDLQPMSAPITDDDADALIEALRQRGFVITRTINGVNPAK